MNSTNWDNASNEAAGRMDRVKNVAQDLGTKATDATNQAKEWIGEQTEQLSATQKKMVDDATRYVQANPLKSVAIAAAAALIVGRLMR